MVQLPDDVDSQGDLFPGVEELDVEVGNPYIQNNLPEEREFLERVLTASKRRISERQDTAVEFVDALSEEFGYGVRMYIVDIVSRLRECPELTRIQREYIESVLGYEEIDDVLRGKKKRHLPCDGSLDELFARAFSHRGSGEFIEAVQFVSRLREYAPYNNMLVYLQRSTATFWATANDWRKRFERTIREDALPIVMLRPMGPIMCVYDVSDTEGRPLPKRFEDAFDVSGEFEDDRLDKTLANCDRAGIHVNRKELGLLHAGTAIRSTTLNEFTLSIEIKQDLKPEAQYATLCHELGHIFLGHLGGDEAGRWPSRLGLRRYQRELEAEAVSYIVCKRAGLLTTSAEYLAGYIREPEDAAGISVDMIMKTASHIERMGQQMVYPQRKL